MTILEVKNLGISFGGLKAVNGLHLKIEEGQLYGLIGPNGAGKTTVFNLLTGVYRPTDGSILLKGENIVGKQPYEISKMGIGRTFQNIRLFNEMSVLDNVRAALHEQIKCNALTSILRLPLHKKVEEEMTRRALDILDVFHMGEIAFLKAGSLPYGKQRQLEIARAIGTGCCLLLLDEPAAGMNPNETQELMDTIRLIREKYNITILLIEHDMKLVDGICEKVTVMNFGTELASGVTSNVLKDPKVVKAYLGDE